MRLIALSKALCIDIRTGCCSNSCMSARFIAVFAGGAVGPGGEVLTGEELDHALAYIASHTEIWEVILTGGDPLMLSDRRLAEVIARLNAIEHVKVIRIHTRVPVVEPERITPELIGALRGRAPVYVLLHCNHARVN